MTAHKQLESVPWFTGSQKGTFIAQVCHVRQSYNWDCGLACVAMVLRTFGVEKDTDIATLRKLCPTTSIWTIDLAFLLSKFAVDVTFYTVTLGANPAFAGETFYRDNMEADGKRVNQLFQKAEASGVHIQRRSLALPEIKELILSRNTLLVALVDKQKLKEWFYSQIGPIGKAKAVAASAITKTATMIASIASDTKERGGASQQRTSSSASPMSDANGLMESSADGGSSGSKRQQQGVVANGGTKRKIDASLNGKSKGYTGHYVLICGYESSAREFVVSDPAGSQQSLRVPEDVLHDARTSFGTDEDILLCSVSQTPRDSV
mmetsp:Transcript_3140/g.11312  ORF Transcript_3140/g.11312 Transcript_3140/m.11312 type:complete len:321 (+) Transcript_3140:113-1075(+)